MIADAIAGVVGKIIDRAWPDPAQKAAALLELEKMKQAGEFKQLDTDIQAMQMQADVNKVEAASTDPFTSRWRPFVGWVCGCALAWHYIGRPLAGWALLLAGNETPIPAVDLGDLIVILLGLLGLGGLRSYDKLHGTSK